MVRRPLLVTIAAAAMAAGAALQPAAAQTDVVKIGALYPLSGAVAKSGEDTLNAVRLAVDIINGEYEGVDIPYAAEKGLPNLGGATIELLAADHQASPEIGAAEAERMIVQDEVAALLGAFHSSVAATASQVAERYRVPFLSAESEASPLTERGFKYFFRTTPSSKTQAKDFLTFLQTVNEKLDAGVKTIAVVHENTLWGQEFATSITGYMPDYPDFELVADVAYPQATTDVTAEVQRLVAAAPDVVLHASYDAEAILFTKTYKQYGFSPKAIMAIGAAFGSSAFREAIGADADGFLVREHWARDLASNNPLIEQAGRLYEEKYGKAMDGTPARAFTGMMVLADAINRAGSTDPDAIREALIATDIPGNELIMPWEGVKFDETGQNTGTRGIFVQTQDGQPATVWPFEFAQSDLVWPKPAGD